MHRSSGLSQQTICAYKIKKMLQNLAGNISEIFGPGRVCRLCLIRIQAFSHLQFCFKFAAESAEQAHPRVLLCVHALSNNQKRLNAPLRCAVMRQLSATPAGCHKRPFACRQNPFCLVGQDSLTGNHRRKASASEGALSRFAMQALCPL